MQAIVVANLVRSTIELITDAVGVQLFQQSLNLMLYLPLLDSLVLVMKGFVQDLPPYLSENLSAFGLKLPSKMAINVCFGCFRR